MSVHVTVTIRCEECGRESVSLIKSLDLRRELDYFRAVIGEREGWRRFRKNVETGDYCRSCVEKLEAHRRKEEEK